MSWQYDRIIKVAQELLEHGSSAASTGEVIAAAFVLNRQDLLPASYPVMFEAWERLGPEWQRYVADIRDRHLDQLSLQWTG